MLWHLSCTAYYIGYVPIGRATTTWVAPSLLGLFFLTGFKTVRDNLFLPQLLLFFTLYTLDIWASPLYATSLKRPKENLTASIVRHKLPLRDQLTWNLDHHPWNLWNLRNIYFESGHGTVRSWSPRWASRKRGWARSKWWCRLNVGICLTPW